MQKTLAGNIIDHFQPEARKRTVRDVRLGLGYTAVQLDDESVGVAFTIRGGPGGGCSVLGGRRPLAGGSAERLLGFLESDHPLEAAVGLATANAMANRPHPDFSSGDVLDSVELLSSDKVGMVGYFSPVMPRLKKVVAEILIFELSDYKSSCQDALLPAGEAIERLSECQAALLTATALVNHTMDDLLVAAEHCREVVVLGSSTLMSPAIFGPTPVTMLSGMVVDQPASLLQVVSEGGGTKSFKGLVNKVNCRV